MYYADEKPEKESMMAAWNAALLILLWWQGENKRTKRKQNRWGERWILSPVLKLIDVSFWGRARAFLLFIGLWSIHLSTALCIINLRLFRTFERVYTIQMRQKNGRQLKEQGQKRKNIIERVYPSTIISRRKYIEIFWQSIDLIQRLYIFLKNFRLIRYNVRHPHCARESQKNP